MIRIYTFFILVMATGQSFAQNSKQIILETKNSAVVFSVGNNKKLFQSYLGQRLSDNSDYKQLQAGKKEAYIGAGMEDLFEPAIRIVHTDAKSIISTQIY